MNLNEILIKWLADNLDHQLFVVDPYLKEIPQNLINFSNRFNLIKKTATEFLNNPEFSAY